MKKFTFALIFLLGFVFADETLDVFQFALNLYKDGNYDLAVTEFKRFVYLNKENDRMKNKIAEAYYWAGLSYYKLEKYDKTIEELEKITKDYKDAEIADRAQFEIGRIYYLAYTKSNLDRIYAYNDSLTIFNSGEVYGKLSDLEKNYPNSKLLDDAYFLMGELYYKERNYAKAKEFFQKIVDKFPDSPKAKPAQNYINELIFK